MESDAVCHSWRTPSGACGFDLHFAVAVLLVFGSAADASWELRDLEGAFD